MPKEFITVGEPFFLHEGGEYVRDVPDDGTVADVPMYTRGIDLRWAPDQHVEIGIGVFYSATHEAVKDRTQYIQFDYAARSKLQALIRFAKRARNAVYGSDE